MGKPKGNNPVPETPELNVNNQPYYPSHTLRRNMDAPVWDQVVLDVWTSAIAGQIIDEVMAGAIVIVQTESIVGDKVDATTTWPT
eukprot:1467337-Prymnesium_polylepis.1